MKIANADTNSKKFVSSNVKNVSAQISVFIGVDYDFSGVVLIKARHLTMQDIVERK